MPLFTSTAVTFASRWKVIPLSQSAKTLKQVRTVRGRTRAQCAGEIPASSLPEPSRFQTEPSSRPIAPAPITTSFFGGSVNSSASIVQTIVVPSNFANGSSTGALPVAITMFFVSISCVSPLDDFDRNFSRPQSPAWLRAGKSLIKSSSGETQEIETKNSL